MCSRSRANERGAGLAGLLAFRASRIGLLGRCRLGSRFLLRHLKSPPFCFGFLRPTRAAARTAACHTARDR